MSSENEENDYDPYKLQFMNRELMKENNNFKENMAFLVRENENLKKMNLTFSNQFKEIYENQANEQNQGFFKAFFASFEKLDQITQISQNEEQKLQKITENMNRICNFLEGVSPTFSITLNKSFTKMKSLYEQRKTMLKEFHQVLYALRVQAEKEKLAELIIQMESSNSRSVDILKEIVQNIDKNTKLDINKALTFNNYLPEIKKLNNELEISQKEVQKVQNEKGDLTERLVQMERKNEEILKENMLLKQKLEDQSKKQEQYNQQFQILKNQIKRIGENYTLVEKDSEPISKKVDMSALYLQERMKNIQLEAIINELKRQKEPFIDLGDFPQMRNTDSAPIKESKNSNDLTISNGNLNKQPRNDIISEAEDHQSSEIQRSEIIEDFKENHDSETENKINFDDGDDKGKLGHLIGNEKDDEELEDNHNSADKNDEEQENQLRDDPGKLGHLIGNENDEQEEIIEKSPPERKIDNNIEKNRTNENSENENYEQRNQEITLENNENEAPEEEICPQGRGGENEIEEVKNDDKTNQGKTCKQKNRFTEQEMVGILHGDIEHNPDLKSTVKAKRPAPPKGKIEEKKEIINPNDFIERSVKYNYVNDSDISSNETPENKRSEKEKIEPKFEQEEDMKKQVKQEKPLDIYKRKLRENCEELRKKVVEEEMNLKQLLNKKKKGNNPVSPFRSLSIFANEYKNPKIIETILEMQKSIPFYRQIKGDGNCFFRAVGMAFIELLLLEDIDVEKPENSKFHHAIENIFKPLEITDFKSDSDLDEFFENKYLLRDIFISQLQQLFLNKLENLNNENKFEGNLLITKSIEYQMNTNLAFDMALVCIFRSIVFNSYDDPEYRDFKTEFNEQQILKIYGLEAESVIIPMTGTILNLKLKIFMLHVDNKKKEETFLLEEYGVKKDYETETVNLFFRPGHYDIGYDEKFLKENYGNIKNL